MTKQQAFRAAAGFGCALLASAGAHAQWSPDPSVNLAIGDRTGEQAQSKIVATSDGGCYISWFDNSSGGYDVYLQRLNAAGVEQWPHNGILIADRGFSSTQGYGLAVDGDDNVIVTYRDDHTGSVQIGASLVAPDGTRLWGATGVQVSVTSGGNQPAVAATSDGNYVVGWSIGTGYQLQKLDVNGAPQWGPDGIALAPTTGSYAVSALRSDNSGGVIALWIRYVGNFLSDKHLYTQRFDGSGAALWDYDTNTPEADPVVVYNGGSVQNGYFPDFVADGTGGAVFGWYEVSGSRHAYVQHVDAGGAELFPHGGVLASPRVDQIALSPAVAYDPGTQEIFLAWTGANALQTAWGLYAQRFSAAGARQWTDNGVELLPLTSSQNFYVNVLAYGGGAIVAALSNPTGTVLAARLDSSGAAVWSPSPFNACSLVSAKSRLATALSSTGVTLMTWMDARNDANDIYAQNVNPDGSLGAPACPADLNHDGVIDLTDLSIMLTHFGMSGVTHDDGDLDGDTDVDLDDLSALLVVFGTPCP